MMQLFVLALFLNITPISGEPDSTYTGWKIQQRSDTIDTLKHIEKTHDKMQELLQKIEQKLKDENKAKTVKN